MTSAAKPGIGAKLSVGNGASPEVFTEIGEIVDYNGPSIQSESYDATTLDSVGGFKESVAGLKEGGTVEVNMFWVNSAQQQQIRNDAKDGTQRNYQAEWPTSPKSTATFAAFVESWTQTAASQSLMDGNPVLKVTGDITYA